MFTPLNPDTYTPFNMYLQMSKSAKWPPVSQTPPPDLRPFVPTKSSDELNSLIKTLGAIQVPTRDLIPDFGTSLWNKQSDREYVTVYNVQLATVYLLESTTDNILSVWCKEVNDLMSVSHVDSQIVVYPFR